MDPPSARYGYKAESDFEIYCSTEMCAISRPLFWRRQQIKNCRDKTSVQITLPGSPEMLTAAVQDADRCDTALASEALLDVEGAPIGDRTEPGKLGLRAGLFIVGQTHRAECGTTALVGGATVQGANKERWRELCEQAAVEQDPKKLLELTKEINELLLGKQHRLSSDTPVDTPKDSE